MDRWKKGFLAEIILFFILINLNESIILAFISIFLHEISHIVVAKRNGCKFNNFKIHIYLAGPFMNLVIICIFFFISLITNNNIVSKMININLNLLFFNILPAYPLDGSRILEIILSSKILFKVVIDIISKISYMIAFGLIAISLIIFMYNDGINISLIIAAIIICLITKSEKKSAMYILMGNIFIKRNKLLRNNYIDV